MAFNPAATARLFLDYTTGRREHTMMARYTGTLTEGTQFALLDFLEAVQAVLPEAWAPIRLRRAAAGTEITLPVGMIPQLAAFRGTATGEFPEVFEPREHTFVGRSVSTGAKARLSLYGLTYQTPADYRWEGSGMPAGLINAIAKLEAPIALFIGIDGNKPDWYPYVNVNYNSYWERRQRLG